MRSNPFKNKDYFYIDLYMDLNSNSLAVVMTLFNRLFLH